MSSIKSELRLGTPVWPVVADPGGPRSGTGRTLHDFVDRTGPVEPGGPARIRDRSFDRSRSALSVLTGQHAPRPTRTSQLTLEARAAKDSRGKDTVEVTLRLGDICVAGDVPAGASKGEDEAQTVPVPRAVANIHRVILPMLQRADLDLSRHRDLVRAEEMIIAASGQNFSELGANAALPVFRALWRAAAELRFPDAPRGEHLSASGLHASGPLYAYFRAAEPQLASRRPVRFMHNVFNGGLHALRSDEQLGRDRIDIQEMMVVPVGARAYAEQLQMGERIDRELKRILVAQHGAERLSRADEAGFSIKGLSSNSRALDHVAQAVRNAGYALGTDVKLAFDIAAASFFNREAGKYEYEGELISTAQMSRKVLELVDRYPGAFLSVEDPLDENDWAGWKALTPQLQARGIRVVADDLTVTQMERLKKAIAMGAGDTILIKQNQNGSVHDTLAVMKYAKAHGWECIISHRSGETIDTTIADLAAATGAWGLKSGAPQPPDEYPDPAGWVRRSKYLRMLEIEALEQPRPW